VHKSAALPVREIGGLAAPVVRLGQCRKANRADLLLAVEHRAAVLCIPTITRVKAPDHGKDKPTSGIGLACSTTAPALGAAVLGFPS